ncbi:MAG: hypothetical protein K6F33_09495, partial [Bacteroidales bacterium]|nr:hypothetical protein [Bacteroidales bacterium]
IPETETPLNAYTYRNYLKDIMSHSALEELKQGAQISEEMGPEYYTDSCDPDDISEYMVDFNINTYLNNIKTTAYKNGYRQYFTTLAIKTFGDKTSQNYATHIKQMNLADHLAAPNATTATQWYIRHGALDASIPITESVNLATMLSNIGIHVDFDVPWHVAGKQDYDIANFMEWAKGI